MIHQIAYVFLLIVMLICLVNYGVDFCFYLKNRYCRFHIGRWDNRDEWYKAVEKRAVKWLKNTPTVKITDNSRYMLLDYITGKYRSNTIQSWQKAALILGLLDSKSAEYRKMAQNISLDLINEYGKWKIKPVAVDCGMLSYAVLKACSDTERIRPAMNDSVRVIKNNINDEGMISYTAGKDNHEMYVDTLGLVCPFLMLYAKTYHEPEMEEIVFRQLDLYHRYGLYSETALPNHAFNIKTKMPLGVYGWGRGTAWYLIGLMDSYLLMDDQFHKSQIKQWLIEAADCYISFQRVDGGFGATLQRMQTYDSSATAVMSWFYAEMKNICENEKYAEVSDKCISKLMKCTRITGAIDLCQGDTKGIGIFAQTYDIMPFAQGMVLRALNQGSEINRKDYGKKDKDAD